MQRGIATLAWLSVCLSSVSCRSQTEGGTSDVESARQRATIAGFEKRLARLYQQSATRDIPEGSACGAELTGSLLLVEREYLEQRRGGAAPARAQYAFLTSKTLRELDAIPAEARLLDRVYAQRKLEDAAPYLGIVVIDERVRPALNGHQFTPGRLAGGVVVGRLIDGAVLCRTSFMSVSSEQIARSAGADAERAVWSDFEFTTRRALESSISGIARGLRVEF
jgi:hypothetical protein